MAPSVPAADLSEKTSKDDVMSAPALPPVADDAEGEDMGGANGAPARKDKNKKRKHDGETPDEKAARKEAKRARKEEKERKKLEKELKKAGKAGSSEA